MALSAKSFGTLARWAILGASLLAAPLPVARAAEPQDSDLPSPDSATSQSDKPGPADEARRPRDISRSPRRDGSLSDIRTHAGVNVDIGASINLLGMLIHRVPPPADSPARTIAPLAQSARARDGSPPADERRFVPDEVVIEVAASTSPQAIAALDQRHGVALREQFASQLTGTTLLLEEIQDQRPAAAVIGELEADATVMSAQPNYLFALQDERARPAGDDQPLQYALAKLHLPQAHVLARGDNVLVGVIDSGIDWSQPELRGSIAGTFDAIAGGRAQPHGHGTAIAGLIAAHARLIGTAPAARILAVRAFDSAGDSGEGSTFSILKGLDWTAVHGARVINMSFAGPFDPAIHRSLEAAAGNSIVLIAAAGNAGPKSVPLYPAADPAVIAVTATDAEDKIFADSNMGPYIALAAPGVDLLVAAPDGGYQISSGTSFSAAEVSGIAALMLERRPSLSPTKVRDILLATGKALGPNGGYASSGPKLADAYQALAAGARN
jgi:subtilisin family serine protease